MKKILLAALAVIICFSAILFVSCNKKHKHSYGEWTVISFSDCDTTGKRVKHCECGHSVTEITPATGHNYVGGVCTDCGDGE